jgi:hypothetical protein
MAAFLESRLFSESKPNGWNSANGYWLFFANPVETLLIPM